MLCTTGERAFCAFLEQCMRTLTMSVMAPLRQSQFPEGKDAISAAVLSFFQKRQIFPLLNMDRYWRLSPVGFC